MLCATTSAVFTSSWSSSRPRGVFRSRTTLRLPKFALCPIAVCSHHAVVRRVHLDDVGAQVGELHVGEGAGERDTEVEHTHTLERTGEGGGRGAAAASAVAAACASALTTSVCSPRRGAGPCTAPGVSPKSWMIPTWRIGPSSGSSTSTTQPSSRQSGSMSASSGARTGCTPSFTRAAPRHPLVGGELLERLHHQREVVEDLDDRVGLHADPVGILHAARVVGGGRVVELAVLGRLDDGQRLQRPLVHPTTVGALEQALRRAAHLHPAPRDRRARRVRVVGALGTGRRLLG